MFRRYRRPLILPVRRIRGWFHLPNFVAGLTLSMIILFCLLSVFLLRIWR